jgi:hypothetical protein
MFFSFSFPSIDMTCIMYYIVTFIIIIKFEIPFGSDKKISKLNQHINIIKYTS